MNTRVDPPREDILWGLRPTALSIVLSSVATTVVV